MSKHTPGPWEIAKDGELITAGKNGLHVARVVTIGMGKSVTANARLIAAAPELLEALEFLLYGAEKSVKNGLIQPQVNGGIVLARAAITKAKGE